MSRWPSDSEQKGHTAGKELMWPPQAHPLACPSPECPGVRSGTVALGRRPQGGKGSGGPLFLEEAAARQVETEADGRGKRPLARRLGWLTEVAGTHLQVCEPVVTGFAIQALEGNKWELLCRL